MGRKVQHLLRVSGIDFRASGNPSRLLHVLGLNPTFTMHVGDRILHQDCPCMGLVVECGFTERNCFGADIFPVRIQNGYLQDNSDNGDPFEAYPEFMELFLSRHLPNFLRFGGQVLLVLGKTSFESLKQTLPLRKVELDESVNHLEIYCEMVSH
jgi:hypothetical protein